MKTKTSRRIYMFGGGGLVLIFFMLLVFFMGRASMKAEYRMELNDLNKYDYTYKGTHYIIFYTPQGGMTSINFTLDSLHKKWYEPINLFSMPNKY